MPLVLFPVTVSLPVFQVRIWSDELVVFSCLSPWLPLQHSALMGNPYFPFGNGPELVPPGGILVWLTSRMKAPTLAVIVTVLKDGVS